MNNFGFPSTEEALSLRTDKESNAINEAKAYLDEVDPLVKEVVWTKKLSKDIVKLSERSDEPAKAKRA